MSTTDAATTGARRVRPAPVFDRSFAKWFAIACGLVPGALLAWDAWRGDLGADAQTFALHTTGWVGLFMLMLSLAITPLRLIVKWPALLAMRRYLGVYAFSYIVAHFTIYFGWDRGLDVGSMIDDIVGREYLWFGVAGLLLMLPLAITSTDGMVSRLGAKGWKRLHRLAYLAALAGVVHFYLEQKTGATRPFRYAVALGALMTIRIGYGAYRKVFPPPKPAKKPRSRTFWSGTLRIAKIIQETHDVRTIRLAPVDGGPLPFDYKPGQYLNISLHIDGNRVHRSYTIASTPTRGGSCEISVKRASDGYGSKHIHATLNEGDLVQISAPAGKFTFTGDSADRVVLVAGGIGITPMMSVIRAMTDRSWGGQLYLIFAVRKRDDVVFEREIDELRAKNPNLHVCVTLSGEPADSAWTGARGRITRELVEKFVPDLKRGPIMMCGPAPMMEASRALFREIGVPNDEILEEAFVSPPQPTEAAPGADAGEASAAAEAVLEMPPAGSIAGDVPSVQFKKAGQTADAPADVTLLEAAEECGVEIPFECRSGICGQCKTKLISGRVAMETQDALTAADRKKGLILACQARAVTDVVIDA